MRLRRFSRPAAAAAAVPLLTGPGLALYLRVHDIHQNECPTKTVAVAARGLLATR